MFSVSCTIGWLLFIIPIFKIRDGQKQVHSCLYGKIHAGYDYSNCFNSVLHTHNCELTFAHPWVFDGTWVQNLLSSILKKFTHKLIKFSHYSCMVCWCVFNCHFLIVSYKLVLILKNCWMQRFKVECNFKGATIDMT